MKQVAARDPLESKGYYPVEDMLNYSRCVCKTSQMGYKQLAVPNRAMLQQHVFMNKLMLLCGDEDEIRGCER